MRRRHWLLALWYACHFAAVGLLLPYLAPWLRSEGLSPFRIGVVFGILGVSAVIAPNFWGWLADHTGRRLLLIRLATGCAAVSFAMVSLADGFAALAGFMVLFGCFRNAALPQFETLTFEHLAGERHRYGVIRLWGSVGFIVAVSVAGRWLDHAGMGLFPALMVGALVAIWLASLAVPGPPVQAAAEETGSLGRVLRRRDVWVLLGVCFLQQMSHGPYYAFFSIHLEDLGYGKGAIGELWALGVVAEIVIFVLMPGLLRRYPAGALMVLATALTALRWALTGWLAGSVPLIALAQCLHAASFGMFHAAAIDRIHWLFQGRARGRGQALYSSLSFGAGVAAGSFLAGTAWQALGAGWTFSGASVCALLALALAAWRLVPRGDLLGGAS